MFSSVLSFLCCAPFKCCDHYDDPSSVEDRKESVETIATWNSSTTFCRLTAYEKGNACNYCTGKGPARCRNGPPRGRKTLKRRLVLWYKQANQPTRPRDSRRFSYVPSGFEIVPSTNSYTQSPYSPEVDSYTPMPTPAAIKAARRRGAFFPPPSESPLDFMWQFHYTNPDTTSVTPPPVSPKTSPPFALDTPNWTGSKRDPTLF